MVKAMAKQLTERFERTDIKPGMIITGSGLGNQIVPGMLIYSATKVFTRYLAEGLALELADSVDVLHYRAGEVNT